MPNPAVDITIPSDITRLTPQTEKVLGQIEGGADEVSFQIGSSQNALRSIRQIVRILHGVCWIVEHLDGGPVRVKGDGRIAIDTPARHRCEGTYIAVPVQ
jgi:hypothetical protein